MAGANKVGLGRIVLSNRERLVLVEPRGGGLLMSTLRASDEVRAAEFDRERGKVDTELVALAETIIERKAGAFEPATFHDRYQDALRALVDQKMKGQMTETAPEVEEPPKVINLMDALKRSLARETAAAEPESAPAARPAAARRSTRASADRRQPALLLPVSGGRDAQPEPSAEQPPAAEAPPRRRRSAAATPANAEPDATATATPTPARRRKA